MVVKDFETDDPHEIVGVSIPVSDGEAAEQMLALSLVEEFVRFGFDEDDVVRIFGGSFYAGANALYVKFGEAHIRSLVRNAISRLRPMAGRPVR